MFWLKQNHFKNQNISFSYKINLKLTTRVCLYSVKWVNYIWLSIHSFFFKFDSGQTETLLLCCELEHNNFKGISFPGLVPIIYDCLKFLSYNPFRFVISSYFSRVFFYFNLFNLFKSTNIKGNYLQIKLQNN